MLDSAPNLRPTRARAAMLGWLTSDAVLMADGGVRSWVNPSKPGYRYPEAAGLLLGLLAHSGPQWRSHRSRIAAALIADLDDTGMVGRDGRRYVFDTGIALAGLLAHQDTGGTLSDSSVPDRMFGAIYDAVQSGALVTPAAAESDRWSARFGCHLLKLALPILRYQRTRTDTRCTELLDHLVSLSELERGGRFVTFAGAKTTYLHAHAYAIEGLLGLDAAPRWRRRFAATILRSADWLAANQSNEGGLRAWHDGARANGPLRSDVTAQAVRIWAGVDRARYADSIRRGLAFLYEHTTESGGIRYEPNADDVNTWATIFAAQALELASGRMELEWLC